MLSFSRNKKKSSAQRCDQSLPAKAEEAIDKKQSDVHVPKSVGVIPASVSDSSIKDESEPEDQHLAIKEQVAPANSELPNNTLGSKSVVYKHKTFWSRSLEDGMDLSIQLAEFKEGDYGQKILSLNDKALQLLRDISKPVAVVSICGPYRSGKSYFLSQMLQKSDTFATSSSGDPCTLGIWMATSILECNDFVVVFLDTEGTNAAEGKFSSKHGDVKKIIVFCTLMSSYLIYNSPGAIRQDELENLSYFANLAESIATHPEEKDDEFHTEKLRKIFPTFLWLSRDNHLQYVDDTGNKITPKDHLLRNILVRSNKANLTPHDMVVRALTTLFPSTHCEQIPPPAEDPLAMPKSKFNQKFDERVYESITFILDNLKPKLGGNDNPLDGAILADLAREYCYAMNKPNSIPNVELSWISATELVLEKFASKLVDDYEEMMRKYLDGQYPVEEGPITKRENLMPIDDFNSQIVDPSTVTIQSAHQLSFSMMFYCLKEKILFYMPRTSQVSEFDPRHKKILGNFRMKIVAIENDGKKVAVNGGSLQTFIKKNYTLSKTCCEEIFEKLYSKQLSNDKINLLELEHRYNQQVLKCGPAKDDVYRSKLNAIPGAPQNIAYEVISESENLSLIVSWHEPEKNHQAVTDYRVHVSCNKDRKNEMLSVTSNETRVKIENVISNAVYSVEVCSFNGLMKGECSNTVELRTPPGRPNKPRKPKITMKSATMAIATIPSLSEEEENGSKVKEIKLIIGINDIKQENWKQHNYSVNHSVDEHQCSVDIPNTEECTEDSFLVVQVQMFNDAGGSDLSDSKNIPITNLIPGPPQNLQFHSTAEEITVTWKVAFPNSAAAEFYLIEFRELRGSWMTKNNRYRDFTYTFSSLKPASTYFVRIGSENSSHAASKMSMSEIEVCTLPGRPNRPHQPSIQVDQQLRSSSRAWLVSPKLHKEDENGSPVLEVIVKQRSNNEGDWNVQSFKIQQSASDVREPIDLLNATFETKVIHFHTIMKSAYGESDPSDPCILHPSAMIPGPPSELSAVSSFSSVKLTWKIPQENPVSVDKYCIEMKAGDKWQHISTVAYQDLFVIVNDLLPNRMYHFRAYAENKDNNRLLDRYSNAVMVTTKPCKPKKPDKSSISLDVTSHDEANLTISKPKFEDSGSEITILRVVQFNEKKLTLNQQSVHKISEEELRNESDCLYVIVNINTCTHFIRVILENQVGQSDPSDFVGVAASSLIPGVPQDFNYVDGKRRARQLLLKWKPPEKNERAAKKYVVEMESHDQLVGDTESRWREIKYQSETKESEHFAVISCLVPCTKYIFRMCAVNDRVKGQYTNKIEVTTTGSRPDIPPKPHVLQSDTYPDKAIVTIHKLEEEKENGGPITQVTVEVSENLQHWQCNEFDIKTINHQKVEVNIRNLKVIDPESYQFFFRVKMWNKFGQSGPSENVSLPFSVLRPGKVQELQANCERPHIIALQWKVPDIHPALVSNYIVQKTTHHSQASNSTAWEETLFDSQQRMEVIAASVIEPKMNVKRKLRVLAKNKDVNGLYRETVVQVPDIIPGEPVNLREDKIQPRRVKVRWQEPIIDKDAVFQYKVEVFSVKTNEVVRDPLFTKKLSKVITDLDPLTQYKVKVTAMNVSDQSSPSAETLVKTVMTNVWRKLCNGITAGQGARRPDPDSDLLSSGDEGT